MSYVIFLCTALLFLSYTSPVMEGEVLGYDINWALIMACIYCAYYAVIELPGVVGPLASAMAAASFVTVNIVKNTHEDPWKLGLVVHVGCWIAQFYGMFRISKLTSIVFLALLYIRFCIFKMILCNV